MPAAGHRCVQVLQGSASRLWRRRQVGGGRRVPLIGLRLAGVMSLLGQLPLTVLLTGWCARATARRGGRLVALTDGS